MDISSKVILFSRNCLTNSSFIETNKVSNKVFLLGKFFKILIKGYFFLSTLLKFRLFKIFTLIFLIYIFYYHYHILS